MSSDSSDSFEDSSDVLSPSQDFDLNETSPLTDQSIISNQAEGGESVQTTASTEDDAASDASVILLSNTAQRFRALGKIVHYMRKQHLAGSGDQPLTLDEILEETRQTDLKRDIKQWLTKKALPCNKRIEVSKDGLHYQFKPAYKLQNADDLIKLLKNNESKGLGGILMDDIRDSLPNYRQVLKQCDSKVLVLKRPLDRKRIVYYIDQDAMMVSDFEVQAMWRSLGLEDIEEVYEPLDDEDEFDC